MSSKIYKQITFGAGCFWGVEAKFSRITGVKSTVVGYAGGHTVNPSYEEVGTGFTGHAEVVQVEYDPNEVSFEELLHVFWSSHNPTTINRQDDVSQYRSLILFHDQEQRYIAEVLKRKLDLSERFAKPITTQIEPLLAFYPAEECHQKFYEKKGVLTPTNT